MSEPFLAQIQIVAFNFPPRGWATCDGQVLAISQNTALFSLLGTNYGGNGTSNFALPNLDGRVPLHFGQGAGLSPITQGVPGGSEAVALTTAQIPSHTHSVACNSGMGDQYGPQGNFWATDAGGNDEYSSAAANGTMSPGAIATAGNSQPHTNLQPYLVLNYVIAMQGIFPPRS
jgi:microcystin-dependent protein